MIRLMKISFVFISLVGSAFLGFKFGNIINAEKHLDLYKSLLDISAFIFAIAGAWLAIIYPDSIRSIFKWSADPDKNYDKVRKLLLPITTSTITVSVCLAAKYVGTILIVSKLDTDTVQILKSLSFFVISILTIFQIIALMWTFAPMAVVEIEIGDATEIQKSITRLRGDASIHTKKDTSKEH
jgi:hypothetical protein